MKSLSGGAATRKYPFCAEDIRAEAVRCRYCGSDLGSGKKPVVRPRSGLLDGRLNLGCLLVLVTIGGISYLTATSGH